MTDGTAAQQLRTLIKQRVQAIAARDAQYLADVQADDVLAYKVLPPLRLRGSNQVAEQTRAWFDGYAHGPGYEVHDLQIEVDGNVGSTAFLYHVTGTCTRVTRSPCGCEPHPSGNAPTAVGRSCTITNQFLGTP
ncbi:hypothetical protein FVP77_06735 [Microbacterium hatanonis]|uniref:SnoaL-like domain-containing protein n=1 Tax=Microbacterium hatanonis TaxID=404366 RepID=A0A5C8I4X3_9MICO|nr:nuclear transport factor 2 family protein [Microbacterium hatanonis]TXK13114.1 hypothetical protein FVP77_06735 [Microbacterium hatanonis]